MGVIQKNESDKLESLSIGEMKHGMGWAFLFFWVLYFVLSRFGLRLLWSVRLAKGVVRVIRCGMESFDDVMRYDTIRWDGGCVCTVDSL